MKEWAAVSKAVVSEAVGSSEAVFIEAVGSNKTTGNKEADGQCSMRQWAAVRQ